MRRALFLAVFAASGAAALVYEVAWTRILTLQLGHGLAAASTVLAAFMGGLAIGAAVGGRLAARATPERALLVYAALEGAVALLALVLPWELAALEPVLVLAYADGHNDAAFGALRVAMSLTLLSAPAAAMGATFPLASRWLVRSATGAASDAGRLYAANTVGAALGALLAGFVLLPFLGLRGATYVGIALNLTAAGGALWIRSAALLVASPAGLKRDRYEEPATEDASSGRRNPAAAPEHPGAGASSGSARRGRSLDRPAASTLRTDQKTKRARAMRDHGVATKSGGSSPAGRTGQPWLAAAALGLSGFASLALQVVWTRLLALVLGPTTYAFSTIVTLFIAGLAIGAAVAARVAGRRREPLLGLAVCLMSSGGLALVAASCVDWSLLTMAEIVARPGTGFEAVLLRQVLVVTALVVPMTIAFGAAFPFAVAVATRRDQTVVTDLALIYSVNTVGAILGALLAGFVLIPSLGLHLTLRAVAAAVAAGAGVLLLVSRARPRGRVVALVGAAGVVAAAIFLPSWDRLLLSSGAYKYAASLQGPDLATALTAGQLRYYREGSAGTVAVRDLTGTTSMAIDGKVDASNAGDMLTQRLLAHVPLLLHPAPRDIAILGLGSGVTLGSALRHPVAGATVLEISPEVVEASAFFRAENHDALADPRTRLIVGDGRTHLVLTRERYDVIISEPSNPWMAGIASLFTRDFFEAARARLADGGIFCQWAHTYDISSEDLRSIVVTFLSVFPDGTLWLVGDGDVLLVGSASPMGARLAEMAENWKRPGVAEDLASVGAMRPHALLSLFVAEGSSLAAWAGNAPVQTDDRAALEFSGPQSVFTRGDEDIAQMLRAHASAAPLPAAIADALHGASGADWRDRGWMMLRADAFRPAYEDFRTALERDPHDSRALDGLLRASSYLKRGPETHALVASLARDSTNHEAKLALSRLLAAEGTYGQAAEIPLALLRSDASNVMALEQLASILSDAGDAERLAPVVARLRHVAPGSEPAHYYSASLFFLQNRPDLAVDESRAVIARNPGHARAQNLLGAALASLGKREEARRAFHASLQADPRDSATYANLGRLELQSGNVQAAAQHFASALIVDPVSEAARQGLAEATSLR